MALVDRLQDVLDTMRNQNLHVKKIMLSPKDWDEWKITNDGRITRFRSAVGGDKFSGVPVVLEGTLGISGIWVQLRD